MSSPQENPAAKPFLKWAGGKTQLIPAIERAFPFQSFDPLQHTYVEPFVGGGAILFWFLRKFPQARNIIINDINPDLVNAYRVVKENPLQLIAQLKTLATKYHALPGREQQQEMFLTIREQFNHKEQNDPPEDAAFLIFLNRTCFNGLYRVNSRNRFNVPFGKYKNPKICDEINLMEVNALLKRVEILNTDFEDTLNFVQTKAFFYFDPPYRPLSKTASFNAYAADTFNDTQQQRLAEYCKFLHEKNHWWLLSNSDPRNINPDDDFFDRLYNGFQIRRIPASRRINSDGAKRGEITELLISNYGDCLL